MFRSHIVLAVIISFLSFGALAEEAPPAGVESHASTSAPPVSEPTSTSVANSPAPPSAQPATDRAGAMIPLPEAMSPWSMFMQADVVVKAVMIGLALASVATWTVLLVKTIQLRTARRAARSALSTILSACALLDAIRQIGEQKSAVGRLLAVADDEVEKSRGLPADGIKERVAWQFERIEAAAVHRIGRGMGVLATVGAVAPFVGLFGTVWGIMNSFIGISHAHTTNLAVVAPGIAEALLATAFGLAAAIPAVVIYNAFARATGSYRAALADSSVAILRLLSRDLDRQSMPVETRRNLRTADAPSLSIANPAE
jgi:biopolymer transport protein ExbB